MKNREIVLIIIIAALVSVSGCAEPVDAYYVTPAGIIVEESDDGANPLSAQVIDELYSQTSYCVAGEYLPPNFILRFTKQKKPLGMVAFPSSGLPVMSVFGSQNQEMTMIVYVHEVTHVLIDEIDPGNNNHSNEAFVNCIYYP